MEAAKILSEAIQSSPEWLELVSTRRAIHGDRELGKMITRHNELEGAQEVARQNGQNFAGKELVELIALRSRIQSHEFTAREQEAGRAVAQLLKQVNRSMSESLGFDFASSVAPRRERCCG
jgi:cell fate (sporulation/competence/biofilm development) regulator YlbF (YheA/YmcA/DUF963 family)